MPPHNTFVLVHGAWGGAWVWKRVLARLRAAGREVHAVTLTGCGERAHLRHAGIDLFTHVADVLALIDAEELGDITLVGHSYGGQVITGVADRLLQRACGGKDDGNKGVAGDCSAQADAADSPSRDTSTANATASTTENSTGNAAGQSGSTTVDSTGSPTRATGACRVRQLVYVDAMVPLPGEGWGDLHPPKVVAARRAAAAAHDNALPPVDPVHFGIEGADRDWLLRRHVPHPFGAYQQPLPFDGERWAALPRCFVDCVNPAYATIAEARLRVRQQPGWHLVELDTGHFPMLTRPGDLTELLLELS
jgi:pimeloyl-ACP methyl ester carboxylesterase